MGNTSWSCGVKYCTNEHETPSSVFGMLEPQDKFLTISVLGNIHCFDEVVKKLFVLVDGFSLDFQIFA